MNIWNEEKLEHIRYIIICYISLKVHVLMSHYNNIWHSGACSIHVLHTSLRLRLQQTIVNVNTSCAQLHVFFAVLHV